MPARPVRDGHWRLYAPGVTARVLTRQWDSCVDKHTRPLAIVTGHSTHMRSDAPVYKTSERFYSVRQNTFAYTCLT